jgi:hypothetical protein
LVVAAWEQVLLVAQMMRDDGFEFAAHNVEKVADALKCGAIISARTRMASLRTAADKFASCAGIESYLDLVMGAMERRVG